MNTRMSTSSGPSCTTIRCLESSATPQTLVRLCGLTQKQTPEHLVPGRLLRIRTSEPLALVELAVDPLAAGTTVLLPRRRHLLGLPDLVLEPLVAQPQQTGQTEAPLVAAAAAAGPNSPELRCCSVVRGLLAPRLHTHEAAVA